jgi:hypothetical protein
MKKARMGNVAKKYFSPCNFLLIKSQKKNRSKLCLVINERNKSTKDLNELPFFSMFTIAANPIARAKLSNWL